MIHYRRATSGDIDDIARIVREALNSLNRQRGFPEAPPGAPNPFYAFAIREEGEGCWVAEEDGATIGVTISSKHEALWFLGYLFIDPARQGGGVGRGLLERALTNGGDDAPLRALITLAYNPVSTSLYIRHGMFPLEPVYALDGPPAAVRQWAGAQQHLPSETITGDDAAAIPSAIDRAVLGTARMSMHRFLLSVPGNTCHFFRHDGAIRGYAYVSAAGRVGPAAAEAPLSFERALATAMARAADTSPGAVSLTLAGANPGALSAAFAAGMRITLPLLLMASRRFGDLTRYAFHSPGIM